MIFPKPLTKPVKPLGFLDVFCAQRNEGREVGPSTNAPARPSETRQTKRTHTHKTPKKKERPQRQTDSGASHSEEIVHAEELRQVSGIPLRVEHRLVSWGLLIMAEGPSIHGMLSGLLSARLTFNIARFNWLQASCLVSDARCRSFKVHDMGWDRDRRKKLCLCRSAAGCRLGGYFN